MTKHRLLITTLIAGLCALPLAGCGNNGQQITSDGITFTEDSSHPFVATEDCDAEDYVNRETDCGFPPSAKKKVKRTGSTVVVKSKAKAKTGGFGSTSAKRRR